MKKTLLSLALMNFLLIANSQTVLNEIYTDPNTGKHEFFELYNSSVAGNQSVDCFTILTYWIDGGNRGWYVMDLPNLNVGPKSYFVGASANPFNTQSLTNLIPNLNWNDPAFRNGSTGGSLKKYQYNSGTNSYDDVSGTLPTDMNDFLFGGNGNNYYVLVYVGGVFSNGFIGGSNSGQLPTDITGLPNLPVTMNGCSNFSINFSTIGAVENVNSQPGTDNGYARTSDGKCGAWEKTSASVNHTPGLTNGGAAGLAGALTTAQVIQCNTNPGVSTVTYNITGVTGSATEADDFPVEVQLYYDRGTPGQLDGADIYQSSLIDVLISDPAKQFIINQTENVIIVYKTKRGCFDKVFPIANGCLPLPVVFKSFTATRNNSNVDITWVTSFEQHNAGFSLEMNLGNNIWKEVSYISSQAVNGESDIALTYRYTDVNMQKGVTQYRVRQIDMDGKSTFTEIRSVRGEGQKIKTIVYPNPSSDGSVNILFEETGAVRTVTLLDASGRAVRKWGAVSSNHIQASNLLPGMYILRILIPETGEQTTEKIAIIK